MSDILEKIDSFLSKHHILSLATQTENDLGVCTLFYAFDKDSGSFIVASSDETQHIKNILKNSKVAGSVALETKEIGKIQGVQFKGEFLQLEDKKLSKLYFKAFPYALAMKPTLWQIKVQYFKMTDNVLGFGKKLIWP